MIYDCPISNNSPILGIFLTLIFVARVRLTLVHLPQTTGCVDEICFFIEHRNGPMVLVVRDQTFPFLCGTASNIFLGNRMAHRTTHGLNRNGMGFIAAIDHKKMPG
jgi:hypothetical protein